MTEDGLEMTRKFQIDIGLKAPCCKSIHIILGSLLSLEEQLKSERIWFLNLYWKETVCCEFYPLGFPDSQQREKRVSQVRMEIEIQIFKIEYFVTGVRAHKGKQAVEI